MKRTLVIAIASIVSLASAAAFGYVRNRTPAGVPVFWPGSCAILQPDSSGTRDLTFDQVTTTVKKAMSNWTTAAGGCSYFQLQYADPAPLDAHLDGKNVIKFRSDVWCHPNDAQEHDVCYSSIATGITTVFYVDDGKANAGTILDTDIELNDVDFTFVIEPTTQQARPGTTISDLENTLTHELGHVQGLDHTCANSATPPQELDQNGNKPIACDMLNALPAAQRAVIVNATMYPSATPGEISKRMPTADDVAGVCNIYPKASDPMVCKPVNLSDYAGCSMAGHAPRSLAVLFVIALALAASLVTRRRR